MNDLKYTIGRNKLILSEIMVAYNDDKYTTEYTTPSEKITKATKEYFGSLHADWFWKPKISLAIGVNFISDAFTLVDKGELKDPDRTVDCLLMNKRTYKKMVERCSKCVYDEVPLKEVGKDGMRGQFFTSCVFILDSLEDGHLLLVSFADESKGMDLMVKKVSNEIVDGQVKKVEENVCKEEGDRL